MNMGALGIVLVFQSKDTISDEFVYFNGEQKEWLDINWREFDFFTYNSKNP